MNVEFQQERDRITMLRELLQMSQTEFARKIGISQGALSQIESGRSRLSMETLKNLSSEFNINCNWIVNGKGNIFFSSAKAKGVNTKNNLIPFINKKARAGYFRGYSNPEYLKTLDEYHVPGFENGNFRMFEIQGDSMTPTLFSSEVVIAKKIKNYNDIENNCLAVFLLPKELVAKRIEKPSNNDSHLIAKSDNPDYENKKIKYADINELWIIQGKLTRKFLQGNAYDPSRILHIEKNLQDLNIKVDKLMRQS
jgi:transcriptional regulator with XRE-family HTH domain